jgi:hypothetical protein
VSALRLEIAGARIDLEVPDDGALPLERLRPFSGAAGPPAWTIALRAGAPLPPVPPGRTLAEAAGRWSIPGAGAAGWLDASARTGEVGRDPQLLVLDTFLRAAVAAVTLERGGILLHGVAVAVDGGGHLCPARSGSGKSTLAAGAGHPLSDEISIVLPGPAGFAVHATPWWTSRGGAAPLTAVYALAWGGEAVTWLPQSALRTVAANIVLPVDTPANRRRALEVAAAVAAVVPFGKLTFRQDSDVDRLLRGGRGPRSAGQVDRG